jgi:hypothetical protein
MTEQYCLTRPAAARGADGTVTITWRFSGGQDFPKLNLLAELNALKEKVLTDTKALELKESDWQNKKAILELAGWGFSFVDCDRWDWVNSHNNYSSDYYKTEEHCVMAAWVEYLYNENN